MRRLLIDCRMLNTSPVKRSLAVKFMMAAAQAKVLSKESIAASEPFCKSGFTRHVCCWPGKFILATVNDLHTRTHTFKNKFLKI